MKNKNIKSKTIETINVSIQNAIKHKEYKKKIRHNLSITIEHLNDVLFLLELKDALQEKIDTYEVDDTSYSYKDYRRDNLILSYLNKKVNDSKRIKTDYQYALQSD